MIWPAPPPPPAPLVCSPSLSAARMLALRSTLVARYLGLHPEHHLRPLAAAALRAPPGGAAADGDDAERAPQDAAAAAEEAKAAALRLLGGRPHARKELEAKLAERGHGRAAAAAALDRLADVGLQSDAEFAEVFARSKWRQAKWGPSRIGGELRRRGVAPAHAASALEGVFGEGGRLEVRRFIEEEADEAAGEAGEGSMRALGDGEAPVAALLRTARDRWARTAGLDAAARKRRLAGWLQRRGHVWDDVARVVARVEAEEAEARR
jgi:SOS response regulatory protein OraA/RecX